MNCNNEKCVLEKCSNCNNIELSKIGLNDSELQKETNKYLPVKYISDEYKCNFSTDIHKNSKNYIKRPNVLKFHNQKSKDHIEQINEKEAFDIINEKTDEFEDESSDEDKWFPIFRFCECCKGFIFNCQGKACTNMRYCYCRMKTECDNYF